MQAVILAGGQGTRLQPFTLENPKPMYPIQGRPYMAHLLEQVRDFGISEAVLLLGYKAEKIIDYLAAEPIEGLTVQYSVTPVEYETGARLRAAAGFIHDDFLLMYCDNYCPISFAKHLAAFRENHALVQMTAYANRDGYTKNNLLIEDGQVKVYDKARQTPGLNGVDIGYALIAREVLDWLPEENISFERFAYARALEQGRLYATVTEHRYYSIGSYARMPLTERFFSGRKAVFLDRDGTLNERPPRACYIERPEDFVWLPGAKEAVRLLNEAGYLVLLVTNQPGLARGQLTEDTLAAIHEKMEADLRRAGARIDRIYMCPHNWDDGCFCRKPQPGMLYEAQREYDLDLPKDCVLFGDDERDIEAATRADCRGVLVTDSYTLLDAVKDLLAEKAEQ